MDAERESGSWDRASLPRENLDGGFLDTRGRIDFTKNRLPHWQQEGKFVFATWRLADSLPRAMLDAWAREREQWIKLHPQPWDGATEEEYHDRFSEQIEDWLDRGMGSCALRDPVLAGLVADALRHFDGARYGLESFVVMPNHVHVLFRLVDEHTLSSVLQSWKGYTARVINRRIQRSGALWQADYWDRLIRNRQHFASCLAYIRSNPSRAGLRQSDYLLWERAGAGIFSRPR